MGGTEAEFPLLNSLGLYAADIRGDGNCLFNALSDQLYGHQNEHPAIRSRVIEYMREHKDYYKQFIDVHPGGGFRRNPKRKNAGGYSSSSTNNSFAPTEADMDRVFEQHLQSMAKGGTWGDNMEITAFSFAFDYNVQIYMRDFSYVISPVPEEEGTKPVAHIAYHAWEHYSSIRNLDGPHTGLPEVAPRQLSPEEERKQQEKLAQSTHVLPWMIEVVEKSLPFLTDKITLKRALEAAKGNIDVAVSNLLDAEENGSASSHHESSSVERDHDSDDDMFDGPNKKQDRRMSRASKAQKGRRPETKHALSQLTTFDGSQESFTSWESEASSLPDSSQKSTSTKPDPASEPNATTVKKPESNGTSTVSQPQQPAKPQPRLKLLPPKPPDPSQRAGKTQQRQSGPRMTARDKKDIKKQAQKAARKERSQAAAKPGTPKDASQIGVAIRKGMTETPPVETLRTLYI